VDRGIRRIWGALGVGDDTELHLEPVGHWGPSARVAASGGDYRTGCGASRVTFSAAGP
jgi:hypothetical protein